MPYVDLNKKKKDKKFLIGLGVVLLIIGAIIIIVEWVKSSTENTTFYAGLGCLFGGLVVFVYGVLY
jgi:hypothetical protein